MLQCCRWHFSCTDLLDMLTQTITLEQDPNNDGNTVQSMIVDGLGFYSREDSSTNLQSGFYIDEVSFASERRQFLHQYVSVKRYLWNHIHSCNLNLAFMPILRIT